MPRKGPKVLYKVWLKKRSSKDRIVFTLAASPEQAVRFAEHKNPGFEAKKIAVA